jgi:outer membrane protein TolC
MRLTIHLLLYTTFSLSSLVVMADASRLTMPQFLSEVRATSPEFAIEKANVEGSRARASGIRINAPMIGYMQMKDGSGTNHGLEIAQEIPFPTKISHTKKVRDLELEAQLESSQLQEVSLLAEARAAFVAFWSTYARLNIQKEKHDWLINHVKITRTTSWSDTAAKIHLLEVETDADLVENEVLALESDLVEKRNGLKIYAPGLKVDDLIPVEPEPIPIKFDKHSPSLLVTLREKELHAKEALVDLQKQAYAPDLFVRLRSYNGNESTPRSQELMVGISVPFLYFWQPKAEVAEASAQRMKAQAELQKSKIDLDGRFSSLIKRAESTQAQIRNLKEKLIPRSERQAKLVQNLSQRTMEGLDEHKKVMLGLLDLRIRAIELRVAYEDLTKNIMQLTGVTSVEESSK